jgi:hypothetical protein
MGTALGYFNCVVHETVNQAVKAVNSAVPVTGFVFQWFPLAAAFVIVFLNVLYKLVDPF